MRGAPRIFPDASDHPEDQPLQSRCSISRYAFTFAQVVLCVGIPYLQCRLASDAWRHVDKPTQEASIGWRYPKGETLTARVQTSLHYRPSVGPVAD
ncbi:hypothetical protein PMI11_00228 [Rhizobium sp. CF142]|nr:hypothetical protein PMI11_00228 [Rhizobium sp. CF142]